MSERKRVAVITGASSGIGRQAARDLAARGWRVIGVGRSADRCAATEREIRDAGGEADMLCADLSLVAEAERLADEIGGMTEHIYLLANNAGGMAADRVMTAEGHEQNFAANHLGPFVLTNRLLPLLLNAARDRPPGSVRIVNTSSDGSEMIPSLDLGDMENLGNWSSGGAYCSGKLANVLHARALSDRLAGTGIVAHSFHPGTVDSGFFEHTPPQVRERYRDMPKRSLAEGADTLVWLATADAPGRSSGLYWHDRAEREPHALVKDADFVRRFWTASEALAARRKPSRSTA